MRSSSMTAGCVEVHQAALLGSDLDERRVIYDGQSPVVEVRSSS